ncbi:hypothetical protein [Nonomuraea sp. NPDC003201]
MSPREVSIGNHPGWLLAFGSADGLAEPWFVSSDDAHAEIHAALPQGLEGGTYRFTIERLPDALFAKLSKRDKLDRRVYTVVKLYLFWREALAGAADYLKGLAGLDRIGNGLTPDRAGAEIAVLSVVGVARANGDRGVETEITCRERVFQHLSERAICSDKGGIDATSLPSAISTVLDRLDLKANSRTYSGPLATPAPAVPGKGKQQIKNGTGGVEALRDLAGRIEQQTGLYGRGMLLIRRGTLHVGPREIPLSGDGADVTEAGGLADVQPLEPIVTDPAFDRCAHPGEEPPSRRQYRLICKGRPDLRPGDVVRFTPPPGETPSAGFGAASLFGSIGVLASASSPHGASGSPIRLYVNAVEHKLGRRSGFVTTLTGVELPQGRSQWDARTAPPRKDDEETSADAGTDSARQIRALARAAAAGLAQAEVGELRATTSAGDQSRPAQSVTVWRGLTGGQGDANQGGRLPVARPSPAPASDVPYLTPFAFGRAGLVLPAYPGTRVAVVHRLGDGADPMVAGALWTAGEAPDSAPGDWWLILPSAVPTAERDSIADSAVPSGYRAAASDDLIDADGNRVIEVGELTVRVGKAALQEAGTRPERAADGQSVTIEHADGRSKIVMKADGTIQIVAGKDLEITAQNVKVKVSGTMDVSG